MTDSFQKALAFGALQRYWVVLEPTSAEQQWQNAYAFLQLPPEQRTPGHWYRHEGESGFIQYFPEGDQGRFLSELPPDVDPASVIVIPKVQGFPTIYEQMKRLLAEVHSEAGGAAINELDKLRDASHDSRLRSDIAAGGFAVAISGWEGVCQFLHAKLKDLSVEGLNASKVTGFDVAALMLLDSLAYQLMTAQDPTPPASLKGKMFNPAGVPSLAEMTARFIADCMKAGLGNAVSAAIDAIRKGGDATLASARDMTQDNLHPGLYLDRYYAGIQQAAIRFQAVRWGSLSVLTFGGLDSKERAKYEQRVTSSEEKFVRMSSILLYALQDIDGTRYREKQALIRHAFEAGIPEQADSVLYNVFESQMFYPKPVRQIMIDGAKAEATATAAEA